jgi:ribosome maturation factor RimP
MLNVDKIRQLVEQIITNTDLFITDITIKSGQKIHVALDKMNGGVVIADCVMVSRHIEANLDREKEDYQLDVSSAGMEEPFKVRKQYLKNTGRQVQVLTQQGESLQGKLVSAGEEGISLEMIHRDKQLKKDVTEIKHIPYEQIKQTKKIISFK